MGAAQSIPTGETVPFQYELSHGDVLPSAACLKKCSRVELEAGVLAELLAVEDSLERDEAALHMYFSALGLWAHISQPHSAVRILYSDLSAGLHSAQSCRDSSPDLRSPSYHVSPVHLGFESGYDVRACWALDFQLARIETTYGVMPETMGALLIELAQRYREVATGLRKRP